MGANDRRGFAADELRDAVKDNPLWYHTMELADGVVTPGWFDLRPIVTKLPWPDVRGKRCLDIGTYDGFLAFEMERRGAAEVIATDIGSHELWDWPPTMRSGGPARMAELAGEKGCGFEIAVRALGSAVHKREISIYDLRPETVGLFDVVVCGSLLLHLRDPIRALEAVRSICGEFFMSSEEIDLALTLAHRKTPITRFNGVSMMQWHVANLAGHRRMVGSAGFELVRGVRPYSVRFGPSHPTDRGSWRRRFTCRLITGSVGVPHSAVLARPV